MQYYPRTGNLAVRRELANKAGGFSTYSHGEDIEFSHRVFRLGTRVAFAESAVVQHNEKRNLAQEASEAAYKGMARVRLARQYGVHELIHSLPAIFCLYFVVFSVMAVVRYDLLSWFIVPMALYALALGILAFQGSRFTRDWRVGLLVPFYAMAMHLGYGLGYLYGWFDALVLRPFHGSQHQVHGPAPLPPASEADGLSKRPAVLVGNSGKPAIP